MQPTKFGLKLISTTGACLRLFDVNKSDSDAGVDSLRKMLSFVGFHMEDSCVVGTLKKKESSAGWHLRLDRADSPAFA